MFRACSLHYDLCVAGGGYFTGIFSEHWSIQMLLVTVSLLSGLMIYIIIMNRAELNSSLSARFVKALKMKPCRWSINLFTELKTDRSADLRPCSDGKMKDSGILALKYLYRFLKGKGCRRM